MLENIQEFFSGTHGLVVLVMIGVVGAFLKLKLNDLKVREHKFFGQLATALTDFGLSETYTKALSDLSAGDVPSAIGAAEHAITAIKVPGAMAAEIASVVAKALADPTRKAALLKTVGDIAGGASPEQIKADILAEFKAGPLANLTPGPIAEDFQHLKERIDAIKANPSLAGLLAHLPDGHGIFAGLIDAAHSIGAQSVAPATAAGALPPVPDGHTVTIEKTAS